MEFPTLGEQCQHKTCNRIDFLPLQCRCEKLFCREHFIEHCVSGECPLAPKPLEINQKSPKKVDKIFRCSQEGCRKGNLHEMPCPKCNKHFCVEHRFHESCPEIDDETMAAKIEEFEAPRRQFKEANKHLQEKITNNIRKALKSSSKVQTASKIHLMRVKQKAVGPKTVPPCDRVYFAIKKPIDFNAKSVKVVKDEENIVKIDNVVLDPDIKDTSPVFISSKWSLGRALDSICDTCNIKNENHKMGDTKLRIFRQLDGYCVSPIKMDVEVSDLMKQEILLEGDKLVIEYISNNILSNLEENDHVFLAQ